MATGRGNGQFDVMGQGFDGVGGIDITLNYDKNTANDPRILQGELISGAVMMPNLTVPGTVRVGIIFPNPLGISGNGKIVTLTLISVAGAEGTVSNFTARVINSKGVEIASQAQIIPWTGSGNSVGSTPVSSAISSASGSAASSATQGSGAMVSLGSVSMQDTKGVGVLPQPVTPTPPPSPPSVEPVVTEQKKNVLPELIETPAVVEESQPLVASTTISKPGVVPTAGVKQVAEKSIPELFRDDTGPRTVAAMTSLFLKTTSSILRQEPSIVLSDGVSKIKLYVNLPQVDAKTPNFALNGANLVSLQKNGDVYLLDVIPHKNSNEAKVTILNNGSITDVPLIVAQPINVALIPGGKLSESALGLFLKGEPGKRCDLNGDGKIDYLDDYIIVANYLVEKNAAALKSSAQDKSPAVRVNPMSP